MAGFAYAYAYNGALTTATAGPHYSITVTTRATAGSATQYINAASTARPYVPPARPVVWIIPYTYPGQQSRRGRPVWVRAVSAIPPPIPTTMPRRWRDFRRDC